MSTTLFILLAVAIAAIIAWSVISKYENLNTRLLKFVGFGVVFWIVVFIEAMLLAVYYMVTN